MGSLSGFFLCHAAQSPHWYPPSALARGARSHTLSLFQSLLSDLIVSPDNKNRDTCGSFLPEKEISRGVSESTKISLDFIRKSSSEDAAAKCGGVSGAGLASWSGPPCGGVMAAYLEGKMGSHRVGQAFYTHGWGGSTLPFQQRGHPKFSSKTCQVPLSLHPPLEPCVFPC